MEYYKLHKIRWWGGSYGIALTEPLNLLKTEIGDKVAVTVKENKIIIEVVKNE
jgi:antitoxin component of MazEF toxin-antitoxin module